jgi:hypothetical protein
MSREVCGICWCPYDEETGACGCEPALKEHDMSDLRTAAQQALEALEMAEFDPHSSDAVHKAITALRAALAELVQEPQRKPLTEEAIQELSQQHKFDSRMVKFVRIVEAAHEIT